MSERTANRIKRPRNIRSIISCSFRLPTSVKPPEQLGVVTNPIDPLQHLGHGGCAVCIRLLQLVGRLRWMDHLHTHPRLDTPAPNHKTSHRNHGSLLLAFATGYGPVCLM